MHNMEKKICNDLNQLLINELMNLQILLVNENSRLIDEFINLQILLVKYFWNTKNVLGLIMQF